MCTTAAVADLGKTWVSGNNGSNVEIPRISMCSCDGWQPQRHHRLHYGCRSLHILRGDSSSAISIFKVFRPNVSKWFATSEVASQGSGNINPGWGSSWEQTLGGWSSDEGGVLWDAHAIAEAVNGKVVADGDGTMGSICTDTRSLRHGQWFLALTGRNFDGHAFIHQAGVKDCTGVIANHVPDGWSRGFVQVEGGDTLKALQGLASNVRARFRGPVVGITGSVGKTTVRAMAALALTGLGGHVHETQGNLNNHVGVPLTLLRLNSQSVACVLEMGMNHRGEILELAEIARPDVRVVLNVGPAHMENFSGGLEEVAMAKGEMFKNARPGDICVVNADDPLAMAISVPAGVRVVCILLYPHLQNCLLAFSIAILQLQLHRMPRLGYFLFRIPIIIDCPKPLSTHHLSE